MFRRRIADARNTKRLSVASVWEMAIKLSLRKLELDDPLDQLVERSTRDAGIELLGISPAHARRRTPPLASPESLRSLSRLISPVPHGRSLPIILQTTFLVAQAKRALNAAS